MKKNYTFEKFIIDYESLLQTYSTNGLISLEIAKEIKEIFQKFKADFKFEHDLHEAKNKKITARKDKEFNNYLKFVDTQKNRHLLKTDNIITNYKKKILGINDNINILQNKLKTDNEKLEKETIDKINKVNNNTYYVDLAKELNYNHLNNKHLKALNFYQEFIDKRVLVADNFINKTHSYYSKQIMMLNESSNSSILKLENQIANLKAEIEKLDTSYKEEINQLVQQRLIIVTKSNTAIRELTKTKNQNIKNENKDDLIKQKDILKQLASYEDEYNDTVQKILEDFISELNNCDESIEHSENEYKNNLERIKRNYFYNYYSLNNELNNYLKTVKQETNESLRLKLVNYRLTKLRINSYYEKIKELKENFIKDTSKLKNNYEESVQSNQFNKTLAEINKNYELEVAKIEFNTIKENNELLSKYVKNQIDTKISGINNKIEYEILKNKYACDLETAKLDQNINRLKALQQYDINKLKLEIQNKEALINNTKNVTKLQEEYYKDTSLAQEKLEQVIANLELDRNAKIKDYNNKIYQLQKELINIYRDFQINRINLYNDYLKEKQKINNKINKVLYTKNSYPFRNEIDMIKQKEKLQNNYQNIYHLKDLNLGTLNHNRRNYRFDSLILLENGLFVFNLLEKLTLLLNNIKSILNDKIKNETTNYILLYKNLASIILNYYEAVLKNFREIETIIIEERIQNETKNTYKNQKNDLIINFSSQKNKLYTKQSEYKNLIKKYDENITIYQKKLNELTKKYFEIKHGNDFFKLLLNKEFLTIKREINDTTKSIKLINNKKKRMIKFIKNIDKEIIKLEHIHSKNLRKSDEALKFEYNSSYILVYKSNFLLRKYLLRLKNLDRKYLKYNNFDDSFFIKLKNINKSAKSDSLKLFQTFSKANENKYINNQKSIIKNYRSSLKTAIINNKKSEVVLAKQHKKIAYKIAVTFDDVNNSLINLNHDFKNNINKLNHKTNKLISHNNNVQKAIKKSYTNILYAIADNISYSRANYFKENKKREINYSADLANINNNYKGEIEKNNTTILNYKRRLNLDNKNIPLNYDKTVNEIKNNLRNAKSKFNKINLKNNFATRINKKNYQRDRVNNISRSTNKLLAEKIKLNKTIKKLKTNNNKNRGMDTK